MQALVRAELHAELCENTQANIVIIFLNFVQLSIGKSIYIENSFGIRVPRSIDPKENSLLNFQNKNVEWNSISRRQKEKKRQMLKAEM